MANLPINRSVSNTRQQHLDDHNELHRKHNELDKDFRAFFVTTAPTAVPFDGQLHDFTGGFNNPYSEFFDDGGLVWDQTEGAFMFTAATRGFWVCNVNVRAVPTGGGAGTVSPGQVMVTVGFNGFEDPSYSPPVRPRTLSGWPGNATSFMFTVGDTENDYASLAGPNGVYPGIQTENPNWPAAAPAGTADVSIDLDFRYIRP